MEQYQNKWEQRILRSTLNAITDFPHFMPGWQMLDERVFHPDAGGIMRPLRELWAVGRPPRALTLAIKLVRLGAKRGVSAPLSLAFLGVNRLGAELDHL